VVEPRPGPYPTGMVCRLLAGQGECRLPGGGEVGSVCHCPQTSIPGVVERR
jgi:hypothetical protein